MPDPARPLALGLIAMVVCCVGHTVLLAAGVEGFALIGARTGNVLLLVAAVVLLAVTVTASVLRLLQHWSRPFAGVALSAGFATVLIATGLLLAVG